MCMRKPRRTWFGDEIVSGASNYKQLRLALLPFHIDLLLIFHHNSLSLLHETMATNLPSAMDVDEAAIDEGLYSRQLCVRLPTLRRLR